MVVAAVRNQTSSIGMQQQVVDAGSLQFLVCDRLALRMCTARDASPVARIARVDRPHADDADAVCAVEVKPLFVEDDAVDETRVALELVQQLKRHS